MTFGCLNLDKIFISEEDNEFEDDYFNDPEHPEYSDTKQTLKIELLPIISQGSRFSSIDKVKDINSVGVALYVMIYGREPHESGEHHSEPPVSEHSNDKVKYDQKVVVSSEFKEVCNSLFEKNIKKAIGI